jgi:probable blue pigment (indigoidine) exporter
MSASLPNGRTALALTLAAASWGVGTVISKRAVAELPPLTLLSVQLGASVTLLLALMRLRGLPIRDRRGSPILSRLGVLNPGLAYALSLLGLVYISASLSVMLWAIEPLLILLLAACFLHERIGFWLIALSLVAIGGMLLVIYEPGGTGTGLGVVLTLGGVACCATYTVVTRRLLVTADSTAQVVVAQQVHAFVFSLVLVAVLAVVGGTVLPRDVSIAAWASAVGSGVLYYGAAYWFYLFGLRHVAASIAALSFYLIPLFGVAGGSLLLGERFGAVQWVGIGVVLAAIAAIIWRGIQPHAVARVGAAPVVE